MKHTIRFISLLLAVALSLFCLIGCTPSKSVQAKVREYLSEKYGDDLDFEYIDFTQNKTSSGRYEVNAVCTTDNTQFKLYIYSSFFITDSYSVEYANAFMENALYKVALTKDYSNSIEKIVWLNIYEDGATDYSFRTVEKFNMLSMLDAQKINRIQMKEGLTLEQYISTVFHFVMDMADSGVTVEEASFAFPYKNLTFIIKTDAASLRENGFGLVHQTIKEIVDEQVAVDKGLFFINDIVNINLKAALAHEENAVTLTAK